MNNNKLAFLAKFVAFITIVMADMLFINSFTINIRLGFLNPIILIILWLTLVLIFFII